MLVWCSYPLFSPFLSFVHFSLKLIKLENHMTICFALWCSQSSLKVRTTNKFVSQCYLPFICSCMQYCGGVGKGHHWWWLIAFACSRLGHCEPLCMYFLFVPTPTTLIVATTEAVSNIFYLPSSRGKWTSFRYTRLEWVHWCTYWLFSLCWHGREGVDSL